MKIAIMQPTFNPWLGYFDLIDYVDKFIFLDIVQLEKRSWQTRNRLVVNKKENLFSIPIKKTAHRDKLLIKDAIISFENFDFREKLIKTIELSYKKAPYFKKVHPFIKELVYYDTEYLSLYSINIIENISKKIGIKTEFFTLSKTDFKSDSKKGKLLLDICSYFNTDIYVSPKGSYEYLEKEKENFLKSNIQILYQDYKHPEYPQLSKEFIPYIGIFDLVYNVGFENALEIIKSGRNYVKELTNENRQS